jgi:hypothetical protein
VIRIGEGSPRRIVTREGHTPSPLLLASAQRVRWVNVPIGLITIPLVLTRMRESLGPGTGLDLRGLALMRELGGVFGIALAVAVFDGTGTYASTQAFVDGFAPATAVGAGLALLGALAGLALPGRSRTETTLATVAVEQAA